MIDKEGVKSGKGEKRSERWSSQKLRINLGKIRIILAMGGDSPKGFFSLI
jgi:hypothetical protein